MENATLQQKPKGFCKTFAEMSRCSNIEQSVLRCIGVNFMVFIPSGYMYMYRFSRRLFFKTKYCKQTIYEFWSIIERAFFKYKFLISYKEIKELKKCDFGVFWEKYYKLLSSLHLFIYLH